MADSIKIGGLAKVKAPRLQEILTAVLERNGSWDLSFLAEMPLAEAKKWLLELPGVGPKTVGCVLLFSLGMPAMIVDTHVHRVAKRLNLIGAKVSADDAHDILEARSRPRTSLGRTYTSLLTVGKCVRRNGPGAICACWRTNALPASYGAKANRLPNCSYCSFSPGQGRGLPTKQTQVDQSKRPDRELLNNPV